MDVYVYVSMDMWSSGPTPSDWNNNHRPPIILAGHEDTLCRLCILSSCLRVLLPAPQLSLHAHYPCRPSPGCWVYLRSSNTRPAHFVFRPYNCRRYLQVLSPNRLSICDHRAVLECYCPPPLYRPTILAGRVITITRLSPISVHVTP